MSHKHAYLILAHGDLDLLKILIEILDDERNDIFLHMDRKFGRFDASTLQVERSKLFVLEDRVDVAWGHSSIVEAEMRLFVRAVAEAPEGGYARYHLLSGACLPIKSRDYIHNFFAEHPKEEFIIKWEGEYHKQDASHKMDYYHVGMRYEYGRRYGGDLPVWLSICVDKCRHIISDVLFKVCGKRPLPYGNEIVKGSNWVSLTHEAVSLLVSKASYIRSRFAHTRAGDEMFIHSLLFSHPSIRIYQEGKEKADTRFLVWKAMNASSPEVLTEEHWEAIRSSDKLFARKFSSKQSAGLIRLIREHIGQYSC